MRFLWAVLAFVLAAASFTAGIAQRTVFLGPTHDDRSVAVAEDQRYLVIDAETLATLPASHTLSIDADGAIFFAVGRTGDVSGWLADQTYNHVTVDGEGNLATETVQPTLEATDETDGRNPAGSDLWIEEQTVDGELSRTDQLPDGMSMIVAADGTAPAPSNISVSWPVDQKTPWFGPLITLGVIFLLIGVVLYVLAIRHTRRRRGPIRKSAPIIDPNDDSTDDRRGVISRTTRRKSLSGMNRSFLAAPVAVVAVAALAGCSPSSWPDFSATPTPTPTPTATTDPDQAPPALTEAQAERIVANISETVAQADESLDVSVLGQRVEGKSFTARETNYTIRAVDAEQPALAAIPASPIQVMLPQATEGWPRTAMVIVANEDDTSVAPTIMMISQETAWSRYKVFAMAQMQASAEVPSLAPAWLGSALVPPDSPFLSMEPAELATAYADVIGNGENSEYATLFDLDTDAFLLAQAQKRQETMDGLNETGEGTAELVFGQSAGTEEPISLATLESGAIVAVTVNETDTVRPTDDAADIRLTDRPDLVALSGEEESDTGFETTYGDQLFFFIPAQGSEEKIRLLAYSNAIESMTVLPEEATDEGAEQDGTQQDDAQ